MTIPVTLNQESIIKNPQHPEWVAGFSTGESNFFIAVQKSYLLVFSIAQHTRDLLLLESFVNFLASGFVMNYKKTFSMWVYYYKNFWLRHNIVEHIIPFFDKHPCYAWGQSTKITCKSAAYIIKNKEHLNEVRFRINFTIKKKNYNTLVE